MVYVNLAGSAELVREMIQVLQSQVYLMRECHHGVDVVKRGKVCDCCAAPGEFVMNLCAWSSGAELLPNEDEDSDILPGVSAAAGGYLCAVAESLWELFDVSLNGDDWQAGPG